MHYAPFLHKVKKTKRIKELMGFIDQKYKCLLGTPKPKGIKWHKIYRNQKDKRTSRLGGFKNHCIQPLFQPNGTQKIEK